MSPKNWRFWVVLDVSTRSSRIRKLFGPAYAPLFDGQCVQFASFNFALVDENRLQAALSAFWLVQLVQESCFSWPNPLTINKNARSTTTTIDAGIIRTRYVCITYILRSMTWMVSQKETVGLYRYRQCKHKLLDNTIRRLYVAAEELATHSPL